MVKIISASGMGDGSTFYDNEVDGIPTDTDIKSEHKEKVEITLLHLEKLEKPSLTITKII